MKFLPLALVVLTVLSCVHGRAIHRARRSSSYYANETACVVDDVAYYNGDPVPSSDPCEECKCRTPGFVCTIKECEEKEGCQRIKVPEECCSYQCDESSSEIATTQDGPKDATTPTTTHLPDIKASDIEGKVEEHHHQSEEKEEHVHQTKEESKDESHATKTDEPKSEILTTASPSAELREEKPPQQEQPEEQEQSKEEEQKPSKRSEPTTSAASTELSPRETSPPESTSRATEEPKSSTKQESDDGEGKIEVVTEAKKEGRSGSDEPKIAITTSVPEEGSSVSPQEPEKDPKDGTEESVQKDHPASSHTEHSSEQPSASIEKRHFPGEQKESHSESPKVEKDPVTETASVPTTPSKEEETEHKSTLVSEVSSEVPKDVRVEVIVASTTPQADIPEAREISEEVSDEKKETDSGLKQQDPTTQVPPKEDREDRTTTSAPSSSPIEETKESEEGSTPPAKSRPSKRFADRVDYVPLDFQA